MTLLPTIALLLAAAEAPSPRAALRAHLMAECARHFDARRAEVARLKTPAQAVARAIDLRAKFLQALGGLPGRTPLNARTVGTLAGDGYTVEKVVYESRPGHHVTASFYLPKGDGPFPGVLMPIGHSDTGKAADYVQRGCILLAKNGLAALTYDPIGQGERRQLLDGNGLAAIPGSTSEHTLIGVGALLVGTSTATYRVWDGVRGLDYLASRPEVDAKKLGCTGCSGGGTLTSYLMALDDRIVAAAPSCYVTSLERLFATIGPQDAEQNVTGQVALGLEHADYIGLRAPKPTLILAATGDFFDIRGTWDSFREAKRLYTLLGHPERVDILESDTKHGYPRAHREGMVRWMRRWLLGKDDAVVEAETPIRKVEELRCTRTGQVLDDLKGVSAFGLNARRARALAEGRGPAKAADVAKLLAVELPVAAAKRLEGDTFETEPGVRVPAQAYAGKGPLVVVVHEGGKDADVGRWVKAGRRVLALGLRGWGEPAPAKPTFFGDDFREAYLALHLGRPLTGQRVRDLLAVVAQVGEDVEAVGVGKGATVVLHAAALSPRIVRVRLERPLASWALVTETPRSYDQLTQAVPFALTRYDLPDLAAALAPRPVEVVGPVDAAGAALSAEAAAKAYAAAHGAKGFVLVAADVEADLRRAVTLYASFDEKVEADVAGGERTLSTRSNHPTEKGKFDFARGYPEKAFRVAAGKGIHGGALECVDVLPRNGRVFFPARGNVAFDGGGWGGAVSMWLKTDPNRLITSPFCDPVQITEKGANDGGIWFDFNDKKPLRDLRMGLFAAVPAGTKGVAESDPDAPMVRVPKVGFRVDDWHHVALTWRNLDTGKKDAVATLWIDGKRIGEIKDRELAMRWDVGRAGIYVAINYIGLIDEFAVFGRELSEAEVRVLHAKPGALAGVKGKR